MNKKVTILLFLLLFLCEKNKQNSLCTDEIKLTGIIKTIESAGFTLDTSRSIEHLKVRDNNFPSDSCLINIYRMRKDEFYCNLELFKFIYDSLSAGDSINTNHVFVEYIGVPFNSEHDIV